MNDRPNLSVCPHCGSIEGSPLPISEAPLDGRPIIGLRRQGRVQPYWHGHTMRWLRPDWSLRHRWVYTGWLGRGDNENGDTVLCGGVVTKGCLPTHWLPVEQLPHKDGNPEDDCIMMADADV